MNRLPQFLAELAVCVFAAALLAIPVDEARADSEHSGDYPLHCAAGLRDTSRADAGGGKSLTSAEIMTKPPVELMTKLSGAVIIKVYCR